MSAYLHKQQNLLVFQFPGEDQADKDITAASEAAIEE